MPTFSHGARARLYCNAYDLSPYFKQAASEGEVDTADTTAFGATFRSFITGQAGGRFSAEGMLDQSAAAVEPVLVAALSDTDTELVHWFNTDAVGSTGYGMQGVETKFDISTPVSDVAAVSMEALSNHAFEHVLSLQAKADAPTAGTTDGAAVDFAAATTAGAAGYLQCFDHGGAGTVTVIVQQSASGTASWTDLITFADVTATHNSQRVAVAGSVARYLRARTIKTGAGAVSASVGASKTPYI